MSFSVGIVGLPNVGKSTLFTALTKKQVDISNYPFCTIKPNVGIVSVPDKRLEKISAIVKPQKTIPTVIEFVDIAGLVSGAHKGEGLGNQFLSHIREVDAIIHLVRFFKDSNISHTTGEIKPLHDVEIVNSELVLADLETIKKQIEKIKGEARSGQKEAQKQLALLEKLAAGLKVNKAVREINLTSEEKKQIEGLQLLTSKPILYVLNISEDQMEQDISFPLKPTIFINCKLELELEVLEENERKEYLLQYGLDKSQLDILIKESYKLLDLITFYTFVGGKEARAWTLKQGSSILEAAEKIHTDFKEKFIKGEVINYNDFIKAGSETKAKDLGLIKTVGKDYIVKDGDIVKIKI